MTSTSSDSDTATVAQTLRADIDRIKAEVKHLGADLLHLPKDAVFGNLERSVKAHPLQSLAIATGVGIVIGFIMRR